VVGIAFKGTIIVTKPSKKEGRPKPISGCSAEEEQEVSKVTGIDVFKQFIKKFYAMALHTCIPFGGPFLITS
jgi:hypothetical protein